MLKAIYIYWFKCSKSQKMCVRTYKCVVMSWPSCASQEIGHFPGT